jgi:hypothetical protein
MSEDSHFGDAEALCVCHDVDDGFVVGEPVGHDVEFRAHVLWPDGDFRQPRL